MSATPDQSPTDPTDPTGQPPGEPPGEGSRNPWIIGGAVVGIAVLAVVLFLVLRPDDDSTSTVQTGAAETPAVTTTTRETTTEVTTTVQTTTEQTTTTEPSGEAQRVELEVQDGQPVGGIKQVDVTQGTLVLLVVRSDSEDQVHVHGYDLEAAVGPGAPARIQFRANIAGVFEVELHDLDLEIAELTVSP
ncbi:MAG TPA: hypothetical protein VG479_03235 [Gaiellaceae bacterium]|jgi:hypothetical protein|nr:hypothetical protein [Gaiellaceae bacterium]